MGCDGGMKRKRECILCWGVRGGYRGLSLCLFLSRFSLCFLSLSPWFLPLDLSLYLSLYLFLYTSLQAFSLQPSLYLSIIDFLTLFFSSLPLFFSMINLHIAMLPPAQTLFTSAPRSRSSLCYSLQCASIRLQHRPLRVEGWLPGWLAGAIGCARSVCGIR